MEINVVEPIMIGLVGVSLLIAFIAWLIFRRRT